MRRRNSADFSQSNIVDVDSSMKGVHLSPDFGSYSASQGQLGGYFDKYIDKAKNVVSGVVTSVKSEADKQKDKIIAQAVTSGVKVVGKTATDLLSRKDVKDTMVAAGKKQLLDKVSSGISSGMQTASKFVEKIGGAKALVPVALGLGGLLIFMVVKRTRATKRTRAAR